jgi:hypothetical protein
MKIEDLRMSLSAVIFIYVIIENMINWYHGGFNVYCGKAIWPHNEEGLENLAR